MKRWFWLGLAAYFLWLFNPFTLQSGNPPAPTGGLQETRFDGSQVCKAAIAALVYRAAATIEVESIGEAGYLLHYTRESDASVWRYKCKLEGNRVDWGSEGGRWRTDERDEAITFAQLNRDLVIRIRYSPSETITKSFTPDELR